MSSSDNHQPPGNKQLLIPFLTIIVLICGLFPPFEPHAELTHDGAGYLNVADIIIDGSIFTTELTPETNRLLVIRVPVLPTVLAVLKITGADPAQALVAFHTFAALLVLLLVLYHYGPKSGYWFSGLTYLGSLCLMKEYHTLILTEFLAVLGLFTLIILTERCIENRSNRCLFLTGFLTSILILLRPALIVCLLAPALTIWFFRTKPKAWALLGLAALPLLLWMSFNFSRFGSFTITPFAGYNLFGVASVLGPIETTPEDPEDYQYFVKEFTEKRLEKINTAQDLDSILKRYGRLLYVYTRNISLVSEEIRSNRWDAVHHNRILLNYAKRTIATYPTRYVTWVNSQLQVLWYCLPVFIPSIFAFYYWRRRITSNALAISAVLALLIHCAHMLEVSLVEVTIPRYIIPTYHTNHFCSSPTRRPYVAKPGSR